MEVGLRVVRGPDWKLNDTESDGGEGFVGTVVEVGGKSSNLPENLVWVQWDSGIRHDHRAGFYGAYDLCVLDNAQIGIKHDGIECRSCKQNPILGMCWKCQDCDSSFNLCTSCYMADEHHRQHAFLRLDFPHEDGVSVGRRAGAKKIQSRGIFPGAKVVRGIDWRWKNQDGGEGKEGVVMELKNWKTSPKRGVLVSWDCTKSETYRLGFKGKVDLKCVKPGIGGFYYKDHLPKLGEWKLKRRRKETGAAADMATIHSTSEKADGNKPAVGDTVCVSLSSDIIEAMNSDIEAWTDDNKRYLGKVGTLHSVTSSGGVSILYSDKKILTFHPDLVTKADKKTCEGVTDSSCKLTKGASVRITESEELLKNLQQGHGPWNESVHQARGKVGKVLDVTPAGDVEVIVQESGTENVIVFNAAALSVVEVGDSPQAGILADIPLEIIKDMAAEAGLGEEFVDHMFQGGEGMGLILCGAVDAGNADVVESILNKNPGVVNFSDEGVHPPLIRACEGGHSEMATVLLSRGADIKQKDSDGFTALHHAALKDTSGATAGVLIAFGANVNDSCTSEGCSTPLHIAVREFNPETARALVQAGCNVNLLDAESFTALHYATQSGQSETTARLLIENGAEINNRGNQCGVSPLHTAVQQFNFSAVQVLIQAGCDVNVQSSDKNTALHDAAEIGNLSAAETLLNCPTLDLTIRNDEGLTSFLVALIKHPKDIAKRIFEKLPDVVSIPAYGGMTALHVAALYGDHEMVQYIIDSGKVSIDSRNKDGLTPLDLATAANRSSVVQLLRSREPNADLNSDLRHHNNLQSNTEELISYNFRFGDTVRVKENLQIAEALQLCYGGWNPDMMRLLGKTGFVEEILGTGEVKVSVQEVGETFAVAFIFNPLALVPVLSEDNHSANTAETSMDNLPSDSGEVADIDPLLEYASTIDPFLDLIHMSMDKFEHVNHVNARKMLLVACKMRWFTKVQEIISFYPEAVNQKEGDKSVLHVCCFSGDFEIVMMLLEAGADVTTRDHNNFTPLHTAAMGDKSGTVTDLLLKKGADPSDNDNKLCVTPLHLAVVRNSEGAAKNLAARSGTLINLQNLEGDSPLHSASDLGREEMVAMMLTVEDIDPGLFNKRGYLPIHLAAEKGYEKVVRILVSFRKDQVNALTRNEATMAPIHFACENGHVEVAKVLLETSVCDFRIPNGKGRTPKELAKFEDLAALLNEQEERETIKHRQLENDASKPRNEEINLKERDEVSSEKANAETPLPTEGRSCDAVRDPQDGLQDLDDTTCGVCVRKGDENEELVKDKTLIMNQSELSDLKSKKKPKVLGRSGETQEIPQDMIDKLLKAVLAADVRTIETILESRPQAVNQFFRGTTLLHLASYDGFLRVLTKLIDFGANVMAKDGNGLTPLQIAAAKERTGTATRVLLDFGADPNLQSSEAKNRTALHIAVWCNNIVVVKQLISRKCNVNVKDDRGDTPFHNAIDVDNDEIATLILETPTYDPLSRNDKGLISLHKAVLKGKKFLLKRMLVRSPNIVNEPTREGDMAIHLAAAYGSPEIANILIEEGHCRLYVWNSNNETPCKVALSRGHKELARLLWGEHDNVENEKEEPWESQLIQRNQGTSQSRREENKMEGRRDGPVTAPDDIPDRLLCCICLEKQKNIAFQCGHMNTCGECANKITECPECKAVIKSRLTTYY